MHFTTLALSALSIGSAFAQSVTSSASGSTSTGSVTVHVVKVGNANGTLAYSPDSITAAVGDMVQFQFAPANHTVTQSTFDQPCQPLSMNSNLTGFYSGFMAVSATATTTPTFSIKISNTTPIWVYCSQGKHCQSGMNLVINVNPTANSTRTLANYKALAAKASVNLPGNAVNNGSSSSSTSSSSSSTTSGAAKSTSSSSASSFKASEALGLGGLLALGMTLFI